MEKFLFIFWCLESLFSRVPTKFPDSLYNFRRTQDLALYYFYKIYVNNCYPLLVYSRNINSFEHMWTKKNPRVHAHSAVVSRTLRHRSYTFAIDLCNIRSLFGGFSVKKDKNGSRDDISVYQNIPNWMYNEYKNTFFIYLLKWHFYIWYIASC